MFVQYPVQPSRLILVSVHTIWYFLRCVAIKVICLTLHSVGSRSIRNFDAWKVQNNLTHLHGSDTAVQKEQPVVDLVAFTAAGRVADLVLFLVVLSHEVLHDRAGFEETDHAAVGIGICEGGYTAIRIDLEKPWFLLSVLCDVDLMSLVREAG